MLRRMVAGAGVASAPPATGALLSSAAEASDTDAAITESSGAEVEVEKVEVATAPAATDGDPAAPHVTIGFVGHPNVGKTSLLNAIVGRKIASVSRTPGHTKHLQTWALTPSVLAADLPSSGWGTFPSMAPATRHSDGHHSQRLPQGCH